MTASSRLDAPDRSYGQERRELGDGVNGSGWFVTVSCAEGCSYGPELVAVQQAHHGQVLTLFGTRASRPARRARLRELSMFPRARG